MKRLTRTATTLAAVLALLMAMAAPAAAQTERFHAEASGSGFAIIFGDDAFGGGLSDALGTSAPLAEASAAGWTLLEATQTEASADTVGQTDRDPDEGEACATPALPEPLDALAIADSCSWSFAAVTADGPQAESAGSGLDVEVSTDILAEILADIILAELDENLGPALREAEDVLLDPVIAGLAEACNALVAALDPVIGELPLGEIREESQTLAEVIDLLDLEDDPCSALLGLIASPPIIGQSSEIFANLAEIVNAALADTTLLAATLSSSESEVESLAATVTARAEAETIDVVLPALDFLGALVDAALGDLVDDFVAAIRADFVDPFLAEFEENFADLPGSAEILAALRSLLDLDLIYDTSPLLQITGGDTWAEASFDRTTGDITADGLASLLTIQISESLATLLGQEETTIQLSDGDSATIFEDTPLESTIGAASVRIEEATLDGMDGMTVVASGVELRLFEGSAEDFDEAPIEILAAESRAAVYGVVGEGEEAAPPFLPVTGGSSAGLALLVMLLAGLLYRRTRLT